MIFRRLSVLTIWAFSLVAIVYIGLTFGVGQRAFPVSLAIGVSVLLTFVMQLILSEKEGAVVRIMGSIGGSLFILLTGLVIFTLI